MYFPFLTKIFIGVFIIALVSFFAQPIKDKVIVLKIKLMEHELLLIDSAIQEKQFIKKTDESSIHSNQMAFRVFLKDYFSSKSMRDYSQDQWGETLIFINEQGENCYRITSSGPDKLMNTKDDIIMYREKEKVDFSVSPINILKREIAKEKQKYLVQKTKVKDSSEVLKSKCKEMYDRITDENRVYLFDILSDID